MITVKISKFEDTPYVAKVFDNGKKSVLVKQISEKEALSLGRKYWGKKELKDKVAKHIGNETSIFGSIAEIKREIAMQYPNTKVEYLLNEHHLITMGEKLS